jgi:hypothetical protein
MNTDSSVKLGYKPPMSEQQQKRHDVSEEDVAENRMIPIKTAAPEIGKPYVHSPNVRTNIMAR